MPTDELNFLPLKTILSAHATTPEVPAPVQLHNKDGQGMFVYLYACSMMRYQAALEIGYAANPKLRQVHRKRRRDAHAAEADERPVGFSTTNLMPGPYLTSGHAVDSLLQPTMGLVMPIATSESEEAKSDARADVEALHARNSHTHQTAQLSANVVNMFTNLQSAVGTAQSILSRANMLQEQNIRFIRMVERIEAGQLELSAELKNLKTAVGYLLEAGGLPVGGAAAQAEAVEEAGFAETADDSSSPSGSKS